MYTIEIENTGGYSLMEVALQQAVITVLSQHNQAAGSGVNIKITDDITVQQLNRDFRAVDAPTDVLSFPAEMPSFPDDIGDMPEEWLHLGDLAIAYPYVQAQAERLNHTVADNLMLMVVHGTLHLLGYDHDTPENRAAMWEAQSNALRVLAVPLEIVPALEEFDE